MLDEAELERTLDLWASMWLAAERVQFERAIERVVDGEAPTPLKAAAVAACRIIATPRLLGAAERAWWFLEEEMLAEIDAIAEPRARLLRHAERLADDRAGIAFLLGKAVRDPDNPVADKLLDRVDIRELYAVMSATFDDGERAEAARADRAARAASARAPVRRARPAAGRVRRRARGRRAARRSRRARRARRVRRRHRRRRLAARRHRARARRVAALAVGAWRRSRSARGGARGRRVAALAVSAWRRARSCRPRRPS